MNWRFWKFSDLDCPFDFTYFGKEVFYILKDGLKSLEFYQTEPELLSNLAPNKGFGSELIGRSPFSEIMIKFEEKCFNKMKESRADQPSKFAMKISLDYSLEFPDQKTCWDFES